MLKLRIQGLYAYASAARAPTPSAPGRATDTPKQSTPRWVATQMNYAIGCSVRSTHLGYLLLLRTGVHARARGLQSRALRIDQNGISLFDIGLYFWFRLAYGRNLVPGCPLNRTEPDDPEWSKEFKDGYPDQVHQEDFPGNRRCRA